MEGQGSFERPVAFALMRTILAVALFFATPSSALAQADLVFEDPDTDAGNDLIFEDPFWRDEPTVSVENQKEGRLIELADVGLVLGLEIGFAASVEAATYFQRVPAYASARGLMGERLRALYAPEGFAWVEEANRPARPSGRGGNGTAEPSSDAPINPSLVENLGTEGVRDRRVPPTPSDSETHQMDGQPFGLMALTPELDDQEATWETTAAAAPIAILKSNSASGGRLEQTITSSVSVEQFGDPSFDHGVEIFAQQSLDMFEKREPEMRPDLASMPKADVSVVAYLPIDKNMDHDLMVTVLVDVSWRDDKGSLVVLGHTDPVQTVFDGQNLLAGLSPDMRIFRAKPPEGGALEQQVMASVFGAGETIYGNQRRKEITLSIPPLPGDQDAERGILILYQADMDITFEEAGRTAGRVTAMRINSDLEFQARVGVVEVRAVP